MLLVVFSPHSWAAAPTVVQGTVHSQDGKPVGGAVILLSNNKTKFTYHAHSTRSGSYAIEQVAGGSYNVSVSAEGFTTFTKSDIAVEPGQTLNIPVSLQLAAVAQTVKVTAQGSAETSVTEAKISRDELRGVAGPFGSAAQSLTAAPGIYVYGYGGVAATARSEIVMRGLKGGWSSVNGDVLRNGISFLFDGIPMNNTIANNGQWQTTQIPIMDMIHGIGVSYGPGAPSTRWFDSLGGTVNYIPVQPSSTRGFKLSAGFDAGSYNTYIEHVIVNTGQYRGWSGVGAFGYASNDTFRTGTTGIPKYNAPSHGYSGYFKVRKEFSNGDISMGFYHSRNAEQRPNFLPINPITPAYNNNYGDAVTTTGLFGPDSLPASAVPNGVQYYSQQTSGFYSSLAKNVWNKLIKTQSDILYGKLNLTLSDHLVFHSKSWFRHGYRLHNRIVNYYGPQDSTHHEWYDPASNTIGNKSVMDILLPHNRAELGGYWMHEGYHNPVALYNTSLGTSVTNPAFFNADRLFTDYGFTYLQDRVSLLKHRLIITPGAAGQFFRTYYFNTGLSDFPNGNPANDNQQAPSTHKSFLKFSPFIGAHYHVSPWFTLHGNYAVTYENPTDSAFGANRPTLGVDIAALHAVKSANAEGGFLVTKCPAAFFGSCSLDATYYHDKVDHVDVVTQTAQLARPASIALASSIYNGVSFNFDDSPSRYIEIHGNGIIQHNYFLSYIPSGSTENYGKYPISNSPKVTTNIGVTGRFDSREGVYSILPEVWWQYVGSRYLFSNVNNAPTLQTTPGYGVVNFNT
jgi:iron complex outermembrane receptor protein